MKGFDYLFAEVIMKKLTEKCISSEQIFAGNILKLRVDKVILPDGSQSSREVVEHPGAVAVVPVTEDGKVVFVRQYRYPIRQAMLEIPAGKLDKGEEPKHCAERELEEETGFTAKTIEKLTAFYSTPGFSDEILHVYLASGLVKGEQKLDSDEFIDIEIYDKDEIQQMIKDNVIKDGKTLIGLLMAGY
jgi:ADP-ribose pyrophosphatase